eukprot:CAMPEP_0184690132 /NCGR_PEP_ID=MMETSP0312-20130426/31048_1 /TAXON_ID=31354 /ORGANISM="Compsopogon coeruleus, Strain SAG 36.94" /LENGTH=642 /DNA_ID=CAMNT_0027147575 /DNA_START=596 /DNA_END=2524 /DNA_ORIENTATION=-
MNEFQERVLESLRLLDESSSLSKLLEDKILFDIFAPGEFVHSAHGKPKGATESLGSNSVHRDFKLEKDPASPPLPPGASWAGESGTRVLDNWKSELSELLMAECPHSGDSNDKNIGLREEILLVRGSGVSLPLRELKDIFSARSEVVTPWAVVQCRGCSRPVSTSRFVDHVNVCDRIPAGSKIPLVGHDLGESVNGDISESRAVVDDTRILTPREDLRGQKKGSLSSPFFCSSWMDQLPTIQEYERERWGESIAEGAHRPRRRRLSTNGWTQANGLYDNTSQKKRAMGIDRKIVTQAANLGIFAPTLDEAAPDIVRNIVEQAGHELPWCRIAQLSLAPLIPRGNILRRPLPELPDHVVVPQPVGGSDLPSMHSIVPPMGPQQSLLGTSAASSQPQLLLHQQQQQMLGKAKAVIQPSMASLIFSLYLRRLRFLQHTAVSKIGFPSYQVRGPSYHGQSFFAPNGSFLTDPPSARASPVLSIDGKSQKATAGTSKGSESSTGNDGDAKNLKRQNSPSTATTSTPKKQRVSKVNPKAPALGSVKNPNGTNLTTKPPGSGWMASQKDVEERARDAISRVSRDHAPGILKVQKNSSALDPRPASRGSPRIPTGSSSSSARLGFGRGRGGSPPTKGGSFPRVPSYQPPG